MAVPCTLPGSSTALIADICESAGSCLFILWMIQKLVQCIFFDTFFNDPFQSPVLVMAIESKTRATEVSPFISSASLHFAVVFGAWT